QAQADARRERRRLGELRRRLHRRWKRHWQQHEAHLQRREEEVARVARRLEEERAALHQERLRLNGERELGRRQLQEEWQQLGLAQQQWEECLNAEHAERIRRTRELEERTRA